MYWVDWKKQSFWLEIHNRAIFNKVRTGTSDIHQKTSDWIPFLEYDSPLKTWFFPREREREKGRREKKRLYRKLIERKAYIEPPVSKMILSIPIVHPQVSHTLTGHDTNNPLVSCLFASTCIFFFCHSITFEVNGSISTYWEHCYYNTSHIR